ncbi:hypothetical protein [Vibrio cyclitrophicus]
MKIVNSISDLHFENVGYSNSNHCNTLTFLDSERFLDDINLNSNIVSVITTPELSLKLTKSNLNVFLSEFPKIDFFQIFNTFFSKLRDHYTNKSIISESTVLSSKVPEIGVQIHANVIIEPCVTIEPGVSIGENSVIKRGTILYSGTHIGSNCTIGCYNVIGGEGYEYKRNDKLTLKVDHFGKVYIADFVDTKEFVSIHRALFPHDVTYIGHNTKVDSNAHIGHGNKLGCRNFICAGANLPGNARVGDDCYIGPSVSIPNRVSIGNGAKITIGSTVSKDVCNNSVQSGHFSIPHEKYLQHIKRISQ